MLGHLDSRGVPRAAILVIGAYSLVGLVITYTLQADAEQLILISSSLGLATYLVAMVAAYRLLPRAGQAMALVSFVMCALVFIFAGASLVIPLAVAVVAILYRRYRAQG